MKPTSLLTDIDAKRWWNKDCKCGKYHTLEERIKQIDELMPSISTLCPDQHEIRSYILPDKVMTGFKWDLRFISLSKEVSSWSKDKSTQVGAVLAKGKEIISVGFNGFAKGIKDTEERLNNRATKLSLMIHAEENACFYAKNDVKDCTLYTWPFMSCSRCACRMIHQGIKRHVAPKCPADKLERWKEDMELALSLYKEAGVEVIILE